MKRWNALAGGYAMAVHVGVLINNPMVDNATALDGTNSIIVRVFDQL
jgi:hypothetical protein